MGDRLIPEDEQHDDISNAQHQPSRPWRALSVRPRLPHYKEIPVKDTEELLDEWRQLWHDLFIDNYMRIADDIPEELVERGRELIKLSDLANRIHDEPLKKHDIDLVNSLMSELDDEQYRAIILDLAIRCDIDLSSCDEHRFKNYVFDWISIGEDMREFVAEVEIKNDVYTFSGVIGWHHIESPEGKSIVNQLALIKLRNMENYLSEAKQSVETAINRLEETM